MNLDCYEFLIFWLFVLVLAIATLTFVYIFGALFGFWHFPPPNDCYLEHFQNATAWGERTICPP